MTCSAAREWRRANRRFRALTARILPEVLTLYTFEFFVSFMGLLIGVPLLLGLTLPLSLIALLPTGVFHVYAAALVLGAATVAAGLKYRRPLALASGLQLLGGSYLVYGIAVLAVSGSVGFLAFGMYACVGVLCFIRSSHFRRLVDIQLGARRLEKK